MRLLLLLLPLTACTTGDEGTYHLTFAPSSAWPAPAVLPSAVHWPTEADLTMTFDDGGNAELGLLGEDLIAYDPYTEHGSRNEPDGTLVVGFSSKRFRVVVEDEVACPQLIPTSLRGSTLLYFRNGHVHGVVQDEIFCDLNVPDGDKPFAQYLFDITGERTN